jgi:hypothetical protein
VTPACGETADGTPRRVVCHLFVTASCEVSRCRTRAFLRHAAGNVGVKLPSRRAGADTLLGSMFKKIVTFSINRIASMDNPSGSSNGWRKTSVNKAQAV